MILGVILIGIVEELDFEILNQRQAPMIGLNKVGGHKNVKRFIRRKSE